MISRETIAAIRERADIASIVGETVKLTRRGRNLVGLCPFHKEKTPSFHVSPENGRFYCFGCHEKGSVIDFLMKLEGMTFPEAVRALAERVGIVLEERDDSGESRAADAARRAAQQMYDATNLAAAFFETQLREHAAARVAREELARRGLQASSPTDSIADALQAFRVGYAPTGWDGMVTYLRTHGISPVLGEALGLIAPRKGGTGHYDFFRNRLMFAILDVHGRVVGFSGRILPDPQTGEVDKHTGKYINSPESAIYKKSHTVFGLFQARQAIRERDQVIVVEGNFDVVALHARGLRNVVAPLGTAFTASQATLLRRFSPRVVLLFDGDEAGQAASKKAREPCREAGLDARVAVLPQGSDPDDYVRSQGIAALQRIVDSARGMLEFLIEQELDASFSRGDSREQARRVREVVRLVASEDDPTVRSMAKRYADEVAGRLGVSDAQTVRALEAAVKRALVGSEPRASGGEEPHRLRSRPQGDQLPLDMLGCIIEYPEIMDDPLVQEGIGVLEGDVAWAVSLAHNVRGAGPDAWEESFLAQLPASIHDFAAQRLARPLLAEAKEARLLFLDNAGKLKRLLLSREHARVVRDIDQAGAHGDERQESELLLEAVRKQRERLGL